eukprot:175661-Chlamydomonas_euryale.AAC.6
MHAGANTFVPSSPFSPGTLYRMHVAPKGMAAAPKGMAAAPKGMVAAPEGITAIQASPQRHSRSAPRAAWPQPATARPRAHLCARHGGCADALCCAPQHPADRHVWHRRHQRPARVHGAGLHVSAVVIAIRERIAERRHRATSSGPRVARVAAGTRRCVLQPRTLTRALRYPAATHKHSASGVHQPGGVGVAAGTLRWCHAVNAGGAHAGRHSVRAVRAERRLRDELVLARVRVHVG